jgi:DHA1 family bicyclomycin/chloramphenicol resistance-like MFS transporter
MKMFLKMLTLCMIATYGAISTALFLPDFPYIQNEFMLTKLVFFKNLSIYLFGSAIGSLLLGAFSDQIGRFKSAMIAQIIFTTSVFTIAFLNYYPLMLVLRFFQGVGSSVGANLANAMCRDLFERKELFRAVALVFMSMALAPIFAPIVGTLLRHYFSWRANFIMLGLICSISIVLSYISLGKLPQLRSSQKTIKFKSIIDGYFDLFIYRDNFVFLFLGFLFSSASFYLFISISNYVFLDHFALSGYFFSLVLSLTSTASFFGMWIFRFFIKYFSARKISYIFMTIGIFSISFYYLYSSIFHDNLILFLICLSFYLAATAGNAIMFTSEGLNGPQKTIGHVAALFGFIQVFIGGLISYLLSHIHPHFDSILLTFIALLMISFIFFIKYNKRQKEILNSKSV